MFSPTRFPSLRAVFGTVRRRPEPRSDPPRGTVADARERPRTETRTETAPAVAQPAVLRAARLRPSPSHVTWEPRIGLVIGLDSVPSVL